MTTSTLPVAAPARRPSIAFPLILISLGVLLLLANLGYLGGLRWSEVLRLWPVVLVIAGVDILLVPRSWVAAALVDAALIVGAVAYLVGGTTPVAAPATYAFSAEVPRAATTDLAVTVNYGAGKLHAAGGATALVSVRSTQEDIARSVDQVGGSTAVVLSTGDDFWWNGRERSWDVRLPSDVRTALTMNLGAGSYDLDLSDVRLARATINSGAASTTLRLPVPKGEVPIKISAGMASIDLAIPSGVAYRITHTGFMQSIDGPTSTADYVTASDRYTIELSSAMSSVTIR